MKHRSVGSFIILAALFLAVPQASRDLLNAGSALGARARSELLQALVGLQAGGVTSAARLNAPMIAAHFAAPSTNARPSASAARHAAAPAQPVAASPEATGDLPLELAMILDPAAEDASAPQPPLDVEYGLLERHRAPLPRAVKPHALNELAMIITPDVALPALASAVSAERLKANADRLKHQDALRQSSVYISARVTGELAKLHARAEELKREAEQEAVEEAEGAAATANGTSNVRVLKVRRNGRKPSSDFDCGAPQFVREAPCAGATTPATLAESVSVSE